ncbi:MAG: DNA-binding protein WhiA [Lachnospiraceae bacterium]|nr:DNA-binding protein WhiA [Lachnospiraceae bacterium]
MKGTFTKKVKDEIRNHISENYKVDLSKASYDKLEIKKDLRVKFLKCGMIYDPNNAHRIEYRFRNIKIANTTLQELSIYGIPGKISINEEKKVAVVYVGDAKNVMALMKLLGCQATLKSYKKVYEFKQRALETNRQVNFEAANIKRSADAALEQVRIIEKLLKKRKLDSIDPDLRSVIRARMKYKRISMTELADKINLTKSAVNHRFIRIKKLLGD